MKDLTPQVIEMVGAVRAAAKMNYNLSYGWQEIVECYTNRDIIEELDKEKIDTTEAAINHFTWIAEIRTEHAQEIESTAW